MIPHYQEESLNGENVAKRRVIKKAKEAFEGEEQRAIKSGQILDEVKASYKTIVQNLQLQLLTMSLTKSTILSIVNSIDAALPTYRRRADGEEGGEYIEGDENIAQGNLHSLLIGSLGKLVTLSSQLRLMCGGLADKVRESGRPITGSGDLSKINSLFAEVKIAFGQEYDEGFNAGVEEMLRALTALGGRGVPQVQGLVDLYGANMTEAERIIGGIQRNEYNVNLESVFIPARNQAPNRQAGRADGSERQVWNRAEYELLLQLRNQGLLRGDDFSTAYEGNRGDDSTVASGELEPDEYSYSSRGSRSSRSSRRRAIPAARIRRRGYEREGDSDPSTVYSSDDDNSTIASIDSGMNIINRDYQPRPRGRRDEPDSDDDTISSSGSGLYSLPASYRFPQRIF
jgi:hypothetical protein